MLDQEKQTTLIQLIEDYVYKSLDTELKSLTESVTDSVQEDYDYGLSLDTLKRHIKEGLHKDLLEANPGVDEWSDEFLTDCVVVDGIVDTLFEDIEEACDCDDGDKDDDKKTTKKRKTTASTTQEPTSDEPTTDEPTTDEPTTDEPTTDEPTSDEPITDEPTSEDPSTDEPTSSDIITTEEPSTDEPITDDPSGE